MPPPPLILTKASRAIGILTPEFFDLVSLNRVSQTVHQDSQFQAPPPPDGGAEPVWDSLIPSGYSAAERTTLASADITYKNQQMDWAM